MTARSRSRLRTLGLAAFALAGAGHFQASSALVRPKGADAPVVAAGKGGRAHRTLTAIDRTGRLAASGLGAWRARFDDDTGLPSHLWGSTPAIARSVADATVAEAAARAFLGAHLGALVPGATPTDFTVLANVLGPDGVRTVSFQQHANNVRVLGAAINFAFKADRLVLVSSTALPDVARSVASPVQTIAPARQLATAARWLADAGHDIDLADASTASAFAAGATRVIVPTVRPRLGLAPDITYAVADELAVHTADRSGAWKVYVDASTGAPIHRVSQVMYVTSTGIVYYDVADQSPTQGRSPHAAPLANHTVNGATQTSGANGSVTWDGTAAATVVPGLSGTRVKVATNAGSLVTTSLSLAPGGAVTWSQASTPTADAQLSTYVYVNTVKQFVKDKLNPNLGWLEQQTSATVNYNDGHGTTCNAQSDGDSLYFFQAGSAGGMTCENSGRISDVVYHEAGHSVHAQSIIPGAGNFDSSLSEGLADTLAVSITGDHGVGRGFFLNNNLLRDLAPATPKTWPADADGEPHDEGEIIGEALWDTRQNLIAALGQDAGYARTLKVYYGIAQRSPDIPGAFAEALVADDDNGDLTDGTPNLCAIQAAFAKHGLADMTLVSGIAPPTRDNFTISLKAGASPAAACGGGTPSGVSVAWRVRGGTDATFDLAAGGPGFTGAIPTQPDGAVVEYKVTVKMSDGSSLSYPNNPADPYYQFYVGTPTVLWCADFENGAADWTHAGTGGGDEWQAGAPMGLGGDPKTAYAGTGVFGTDLSSDGLYSARSSSHASTPAIDLMGNKDNVHLQYYRWLGVEDGYYDQAVIKANGTPVWKNFTSATDPMTSEINHIDREWRFQDVDVSAQAAAATDGKLTLDFSVASDPGLELGGWTIDNVCLVVAKAAPTAVCGDGVVGGTETCDDGNAIDGDGCSASCQLEDGTMGSASGGCCSTGGDSPAGALALGAGVLGAMLARRRRYSSTAS